MCMCVCVCVCVCVFVCVHCKQDIVSKYSDYRNTENCGLVVIFAKYFKEPKRDHYELTSHII